MLAIKIIDVGLKNFKDSKPGVVAQCDLLSTKTALTCFTIFNANW
jgi:hypothetical protein